MITLENIKKKSHLIKRVAKRYHATNVRVFGSVSRGDNTEDSDIDFLVNFLPGASLLDQVGLTEELGDLFHCHVDVVSDRALNRHIAEKVVSEATRI